MKTMTFQFAAFAAAVLAVGAVAVATTQSAGFAPNDACVGHARLIAQSLIQYTQDYDETLPDMSSLNSFQTALAPYNRNSGAPRLFYCPATGIAYVPNSQISEMSIARLLDKSSTAAFRDGKPHADGEKTVAYIDGHIERGGQIQGDLNSVCYDHVRQLALAVAEYTQDYDELLPPMDTQQHFQAAVGNYTSGPATFTCPETGALYMPNTSLSGLSRQQIPDPTTTVVVQDSVAHPDGIMSIGYFDGHVTNPDVPKPTDACRQQLQQLGLALFQYTQDWDEFLPPMHTYQQYESALEPYTRTTSTFFCPDTGLPYQINSSLSGVNITTIANASETPIIWDADLNNDGTLNTSYADAHVGIQSYFFASSLSADKHGNPSLVWLRASDQLLDFEPSEQVSDLSGDGDSLRTLTYTSELAAVSPEGLYGPSLTATTSADKRVIVMSRQSSLLPNGFNSSVSPPGQVDVWTTNSAGTVTSKEISGPYDGWMPVAAAAGDNEVVRLLWSRFDGQVSIWTVTSEGKYSGDVRVAVNPGETPIGLAVAADGSSLLLLKESDGSARLCAVSSGGVVTASHPYGAGGGSAIAGMAQASDGRIRLLWNDGAGGGEVWNLNAGGTVQKVTPVGEDSAWTPAQIAVDQHGDDLVLWKAIGAAAKIARVKTSGAVVYDRDFSPHK